MTRALHAFICIRTFDMTQIDEHDEFVDAFTGHLDFDEKCGSNVLNFYHQLRLSITVSTHSLNGKTSAAVLFTGGWQRL